MQPVSVSGTSVYAQTIAYDSAQRMIQLVRGANKVNSVFTYNAWNVDGGRLQNTTSTQVSTGTPLQNNTYDYDAVGNINTIVDSLSGPQTQTFQYDELDRLVSSAVTGGSNGIYSEGYSFESGTGNLKTKNGSTYTYDSTHKHAVASLSNGNLYSYDANGNMTTRVANGQTFNLAYDAENRLVSVSGASTANFYYDADSKQVKSVVNGVATYYVGNHYEVKGVTVTKYYFAGTTRLAVRTNGTLSFLLSDHIGSSSVTTDANGNVTASALYKAFGETRYSLGNLNTDYKFTGQREEASLGIYYFNARWYDGALGRFLSPDSIVPTGSQGTQAWDRYAFVNNNPVRYNDPTGHSMNAEDGGTDPCAYYGSDSVECLNYNLDRFEEDLDNRGQYQEDADGNYDLPNKDTLNPDEIALFTNPDGSIDRIKLGLYLAIGGMAVEMTRLTFGSTRDNGIENAFQHAYWSALLTKTFGDEFAKKATDAHEQNYGQSAPHFMDLHNNRVGREIANEHPDNLATAVLEAIKDGRTIYLIGIEGSDQYYACYTNGC